MSIDLDESDRLAAMVDNVRTLNSTYVTRLLKKRSVWKDIVGLHTRERRPIILFERYDNGPVTVRSKITDEYIPLLLPVFPTSGARLTSDYDPTIVRLVYQLRSPIGHLDGLPPPMIYFYREYSANERSLPVPLFESDTLIERATSDSLVAVDEILRRR